MKYFFLFLVVQVAFANWDCPVNSHFNSCGSDCPLTCLNYRNPPNYCVLMCRIGCECDKGYVQTEDGSCILPELCQDCPDNSHYDTCGTDCPLTCENRRNPPEYCNLMCKVGCQCDQGYVLTKDEKCIAPELCQDCPPNSRFTTCGTSCPLTCENYLSPPQYCQPMCHIGCECVDGYVLDTDGNCVLPENCGKALDACEERAEVGDCRALHERYFFNKMTGRCYKFYYGGCGGTRNNFLTKEDCESRCINNPSQNAIDV